MTTINYGEQTVEQLKANTDCAWLDSPKPALDKDILHQLKAKGIDKYSFKVYLGCWCSDSKKLLPAFLAIASELSIPEKNIRYYSLDIDKKSPKGSEKQDSIEYVPTFIVYDKEKEIGRIIETAQPNLESVLLSLF